MPGITDELGNPWHKEEERKRDLNSGTAGAHLCIPFQCEHCWMLNLEGRLPTPEDGCYVMCLRRGNLDAMKGKARSTIEGYWRETSRVIRSCERINKTPPYQPQGPFPLSEPVGMGLAVDMLNKSLTAMG